MLSKWCSLHRGWSHPGQYELPESRVGQLVPKPSQFVRVGVGQVPSSLCQFPALSSLSQVPCPQFPLRRSLSPNHIFPVPFPNSLVRLDQRLEVPHSWRSASSEIHLQALISNLSAVVGDQPCLRSPVGLDQRLQVLHSWRSASSEIYLQALISDLRACIVGE